MFRRYKEGKKVFIWLTAVFLLTQVLLASPVFADSSGTGRIAGDDRYKTAVAVSQKGWKTADYAVLARGDNYADALCAGPLAIKYNGPILLTEPQKLNPDTLNELKRLGVKHVIIAGGLGAVSQSVEDALKAGGLTDIERVYGDNRYQTSVKIAEKLGSSSKVVLATGNDFPDALSISVIASKLAMPILLTGKDSLPGDISNYLQGKSITQTYIVGGTGVISPDVEKLVPGPYRLSGNDRYETNVAVLKYFESSFNFENIYVAIGGGPKGNEFADALTGAVLAAKESAPLILANKVLPGKTGDYLKSKVQLATKVTGLGGAQAVPGAILTSILAYKEQIAVAQKYDKAGTYGPETGKATISGSVTISAPDVTLRNTIIVGDLLLAQSIGDGNVYLKDVTVKGKTIVNGGGPNSVIMYNFNGQTVIVDVPDGSSVRLVAQGSTSIADVTMEGSGTLQEENLTGTGFVNVVIPAGAEVILNGAFTEVEVEAGNANVTVATGSSITTMTIAESAAGADINLSNGTTVSTLNANAASNITGQGQITTAVINTAGVSIAQTPTTVTVANGVTASVGGQTQTGNGTPPPAGGGGENPTLSVSTVTVTNATTVTFTSDVTPTTVTWNGEAATASYNAASKLATITVPMITKTSNNLVVNAAGYNAATVTVTISASADNLKLIANSGELEDAIENQADGQSWILKAATYDLPKDKVFNAQGVDEEWYFPIHKSITISGEGNPTITSTTYSANGAWASQNFITVFADKVTIQGVKIKCKEETNKAIEVIGNDFTLKNVDLLANTITKVDEEVTPGALFSGSIYFNPCLRGESGNFESSNNVGAAILENVNLSAWISVPSSVTTGTVTLKNVVNDFRNNFYANYHWNGTRYEYGVISKNTVIKSQGFKVLVDNIAYDLQKNVLNRMPSNSTVELAAGTYYVPAELTVAEGVTLDKTKNGAVISILPEGTKVIKNSADLETALASQADDQTWLIESNSYPLNPHADMSAVPFDAQKGWYFPITVNGLTIIGQGDPVLYGATSTVNGAWASQNLITIFGDNVTIKGLTIMPKVETNKSIEVVGDVNFTVQDCLFTPNTMIAEASATNGGSLYFNGARTTGTKAILVQNNTFNYTPVAFDGVAGSTVTISSNTWDNIKGYAIGNTYWGSADRKTTPYTDVLINGNNFNNVVDGTTKIIAARLNQTFTLNAENKINNIAINKNDFEKYINFNNLAYWIECKDNKVIVDGKTYESPYKDVDAYVTNYSGLATAITAANPGDTILLAEGTYTGSTAITLLKQLTIMGSGDGTVLTNQNTTFFEVNAENVTLKNFKFLNCINVSSAHSTVRAGTASNAKGLTIDNVTFENGQMAVVIYAVQSGAAGNVAKSDGITIKNSRFIDYSTKGIYLEKGSNVSITNNSFVNSGSNPNTGNPLADATGSGIDINLKNGDYSNISITGNTFTNCGQHPTSVNGGAILVKARGTGNDPSYSANPATLSGVTITGNTFNKNKTVLTLGEAGKVNQGPTNVNFSNNTFGSGEYANTTTDVIDNRSGVPITGLDIPANVLQVGENTTANAATSETGTIIWASSDETVATVESSTGAVTALKSGITTISYTVEGSEKTNSLSVTVYEAATLDDPTIGSVQVGEGNVTPSEFTSAQEGVSTIVWTSSATDKALINETTGVITPVAAGNTVISYKVTKTSTGQIVAKGSKEITVYEAAAIDDPTIGTVQVGAGTVTPTEYTLPSAEQVIAWASSNEAIATIDVSTGIITPNAEGEITVAYIVMEISSGKVVARGSVTITVLGAAD